MSEIPLEMKPPLNVKFLAFTACELAEVMRVFRQKYGVKPENVYRSGKMLYAGPVPDNYTPEMDGE